MTDRLLLVEQSTTMRNVMEKHANSLGFSVDACDSYEQAAESLEQQFQQFGAAYSGLIFGWPITPQDNAAEFALILESSDHKDLPVVVMSTDMRAETRAWVAARENTAMLSWKQYQALDAKLGRLLESSPDAAKPYVAENSNLDNKDINLLIVDDSATIRYSMRDLFEAHGYSVTLASTQDEAMREASTHRIDIAILDYYLAETTGDELCSDLLSSEKTGDLACTILTGTYSDHIIKRSLRAGAVECMFKNESSELLLSRINGISQFVRQKRQLQAEQQLLDDVLDCIAGAVVLIGSEQQILYVNTPAIEELGLSAKTDLIGQSAQSFLEADGPGASGKAVHAATWTLPDNTEIQVDYQHSLIETSGHSLVRFARRSATIANAEMVELQRSSDPETIVRNTLNQFSFAPSSSPFLTQMQQYLSVAANAQKSVADQASATQVRVSLLMLDVFVRKEDLEDIGADTVAVQTDESTTLVPVSANESVSLKVNNTLKSIIPREHHVVALSDNRYGFLIRHAEESQAYVVTRKIMQSCIETLLADDSTESTLALVCTGSLVSLTKNAGQPMHILIKHAFNGLELVNGRDDPNQAILLDVRRLLRAYPTS